MRKTIMNNDDNESKKHQIKMRTFCPNILFQTLRRPTCTKKQTDKLVK